jgi:cysteine desulfurase/selenocysteine lyase
MAQWTIEEGRNAELETFRLLAVYCSPLLSPPRCPDWTGGGGGAFLLSSIAMTDWNKLRDDFPILHQQVNGHPLVYLDNAATSQKPRSVIKALDHYYEFDNSNVHRGMHELSARATDAYEGARARVARFLNAAQPEEIVFTRGTTESINLVAAAWGRKNIKEGDAIVLTEIEHHSNLVPWQILAEQTGAILKYIPVDLEAGRLDFSDLDSILKGAKLLAITHISNSLGVINPVAEICAKARAAGVVTVIDGAQSAGHCRVDVREIGCDFFAFSGHKVCGPTGIGALYGRLELLEAMPPWQGGGEMISSVTYEKSRWKPAPHKFEAGTPNIADAIGLAVALDYLDAIGRDKIFEHDKALAATVLERLKGFDGLRILGPLDERAGLVSFVMEDAHAHDLVEFANRYGVALRGGHHCNQPLMRKFGVPASARASFYFYNTPEEVDRLVEVLGKIQEFFRRGS